MYLVVWTWKNVSNLMIRNGNLTTVRGARVFREKSDVLWFSRDLWEKGFETTWFAWDGALSGELTNEEFKAIEESENK